MGGRSIISRFAEHIIHLGLVFMKNSIFSVLLQTPSREVAVSVKMSE